MTRFHVPIRLRWNDLDAYGHVNNAAMLILLEEARIAVFWNLEGVDVEEASQRAALGNGPAGDTLTLIARQEVEYLAPIPYLRDSLDVQMWLGRLGGASLQVCYEVWSPQGSDPAILFAKAASAVVLVDAVTLTPRRITDAERAAWSPYLEDPVVFTQRT
jgi:acyl-CoA thioester hydrolase